MLTANSSFVGWDRKLSNDIALKQLDGVFGHRKYMRTPKFLLKVEGCDSCFVPKTVVAQEFEFEVELGFVKYELDSRGRIASFRFERESDYPVAHDRITWKPADWSDKVQQWLLDHQESVY